MKIKQIEIFSSPSRKHSNVLYLYNGERIKLRYFKKKIQQTAEISGPAVLVVDLDDETINLNGENEFDPSVFTTDLNGFESELQCGKLRQCILADNAPTFTNDSEGNPRPINEATRKTLRHVAVRECIAFKDKKIAVHEYDGTLDRQFNCAWIHTPGGFRPFVDPNHVAVECTKPGKKEFITLTSWVILDKKDARITWDVIHDTSEYAVETLVPPL